MKRIFPFIFLCILILVVSSVMMLYRFNPPAEEQCLGSFKRFAYTPPSKNGDTKLSVDTLPQDPWHIETTLPDIPKVPYISFSVEAVRSTDNLNEVWIRRYSDDGSFYDSDAKYYQFLIYQMETKTWKIVPAQVENGSAFVEKLFVMNDGSVWGQNVWSNFSTNVELPLLSKYNEQLEKFEFVYSTKNMPAAWRDTDPRTNDIVFWNKVLLDKNNVFWIIPRKGTIYTYDTVTQETKRHVEISDIYVENAVLSSHGSIFLSGLPENMPFAYPDYEFNDGEILHYVPDTGELKVIENPTERWPSYGNLYVDQNSRLWLGDVGWLSLENVWNRIYPNSLWYFLRIEIGGIHSWVEPKILLESSDKRLWFELRGRGMAWLDPNTMEGCWFTTDNTNIIEDQSNILWMTSGGNLYKLDLKP